MSPDKPSIALPAESHLVPTAKGIRLAIPMPLDNLVFPPTLSGALGRNRGQGHRQIEANTDWEAVQAWLSRHENPNTLASFRREAERLMLWCLVELGQPLSSLTHEDLQHYQRFIAKPEPEAVWVMSGRKLPRTHPDWRPFASASPKASSNERALVILDSMFSWLVEAGYLAGNPLALNKRRKAPDAPRITRLLSEDTWTHVKAAILSMPVSTHRERLVQARARWLFSLLYLCGLRISEVCKNTMSGFFCRLDRDGIPRWWLEIEGKGSKKRLVVATTELMDELGRYRLICGLPTIPLESETTPLLLSMSDSRQVLNFHEGELRPMTRAAVHVVVKSVFERAATRTSNEMEALRLRAASAHWLRHTHSSQLANSMDVRFARDNLGHASITSTNLYLHAEADQRHQVIQKSMKLSW